MLTSCRGESITTGEHRFYLGTNDDRLGGRLSKQYWRNLCSTFQTLNLSLLKVWKHINHAVIGEPVPETVDRSVSTVQ